MKNKNSCPLCDTERIRFLFQDRNRPYNKCSCCDLVFVPSEYRLKPDDEKARYDQHKNFPNDLNYRKFLERLYNPMQKYISPNSDGLDFGSGPGPTLSLMFEESGHKMKIYDYFYADDPSVFEIKYDFITATEVVEHLFNPFIELNRLWKCLKHDGCLGIMTKQLPEEEKLKTWYYKNDPAHVCFFSKKSFEWIGKQWHLKPYFINDDIVIFNKTRDCKNSIN